MQATECLEQITHPQFVEGGGLVAQILERGDPIILSFLSATCTSSASSPILASEGVGFVTFLGDSVLDALMAAPRG